MNSLLDFILIVVVAFIGSLIAATTRGDGENITIKVIIGTVLGTILLTLVRLF